MLPPSQWPHCEPRVVENTHWLLDQLKLKAVKGTFYILGDVAQRWPELVQRIQTDGHRIGSHGFYHSRFEKQGDPGDLMTRQALSRILNGSTDYPMGYRSAYWETTPMPGWSGGLFFRVLPWELFKRNLRRSGVFWIHPYDLDEGHPRLSRPLSDWERRAGLRRSRRRLKALLEEFRFEDP